MSSIGSFPPPPLATFFRPGAAQPQPPDAQQANGQDDTRNAAGQPSPVNPEDAEAKRTEAATPASEKAPNGRPLTEAELDQLRKLKARDREVRAHEQAHVAAAGGHATGGPTYTFQVGPDGRRYAVGGEVSIDTSPVPGNPEATLRKAQQIRRAALAPAEPSSQDRAVAAQAAQLAAEARQEIREEQTAEAEEAAAPESESSEDASSTEATPPDFEQAGAPEFEAGILVDQSA